MGIDDAPVNRIVQSITHQSVVKVAKTIDEYVLAFFGSAEALRKYAHLYILETYASEIVSRPGENNTVICEMHTDYRLRLKTPKELGYE